MNKIAVSAFIIFYLIPAANGQVVWGDAKPVGISSLLSDKYRCELNIPQSLVDSAKAVPVDKSVPYRVALMRKVDVDIKAEGKKERKASGQVISYYSLSSKGATSISLVFRSFRLDAEDTLFIYDPSMTYVLGPLTNLNNKNSGKLATIPVPGDRLILEYRYKPGSDGELIIGEAAHGFTGLFAGETLKDSYYQNSGPCNIDINCSIGDDWQVEKRAVVRIMANGIIGTGAMINNSNQENIPYVLTANHVISTDIDSENSVYWFGYESLWCDGPDGRITQSISGANIVSTNPNTDVTLLRLSTFPPLLYKPYLAGWDATGNIPSNSTSIHHPSGDVKKISVDLDSPITGTFTGFDENGFWKVLQWDYGTTEGGSSGAPLFDNNHRIVGSLTGGEAICGNSVNDYFAKIYHSWEPSADAGQNLKPWLDNGGTGLSIINGRDPYESNYTTFDTLSNFIPGDLNLTPYNPGIGFTTGLNSDSILMYAEKFVANQPVEVTEAYLFVGKSAFSQSIDKVSVYVMNDNNGPDRVFGQAVRYLYETQDSTWLQVDFYTPIAVSGVFYIAYRVWYDKPVSQVTSQFALYHSHVVAPSENTAWYRDINGWKEFLFHPYDQNGRHLIIKTITAGNTLYNGIEVPHLETNSFTVFPNPAADFINIRSNILGLDRMVIKIYSADSRLLKKVILKSPQSLNRLNLLGDIAPGSYLLVLETGEISETKRIIKIKR